MKVIIILMSGLLTFHISSFTQNYKSIFSKDTTQWNVFMCKAGAVATIAYYSFSDTVINLKSYHKIYRELIFDSEQSIGQGDLCGFVHEDTINGKYWFLKPIDTEYEEGLFMDLNLNKGDTFINFYSFRYFTDDAFVVDSVYYKEEKKIIEFSVMHTDCINEFKIKFIEKVGVCNGFFMVEENWAEDFALLCKYNKDTLFYSTESNIYGNCFIPLGDGIEYNSLNMHVNIYPNPSNGLINIELGDNHYEDLCLKVYNSDGTLILKESINDTYFQFKINEPGLYLLEITDGIKKYSKKIIVTG